LVQNSDQLSATRRIIVEIGHIRIGPAKKGRIKSLGSGSIYRAKMLVQIYEIVSPDEARALGEIGVDHIGILVGDGSFPRERSVDQARLIFSAIPPSSKGLPLVLSADVRVIEHTISELKPAIVHLGASTDLLTSPAVRQLTAFSAESESSGIGGFPKPLR